MITTEQLAQWRVVCEKATPGPWIEDGCASVESSEGFMIADYVPDSDNVDFIVVARSALPALLDEVERLRALLREWDAKCQGHCDTEAIAEQVEVLG